MFYAKQYFHNQTDKTPFRQHTYLAESRLICRILIYFFGPVAAPRSWTLRQRQGTKKETKSGK